MSICETPYCLAPKHALGLCAVHFQEAKRRVTCNRPASSVPTHMRKTIRDPLCTVQGCGAPHRGLGYCRRHYERFKRHGNPYTVLTRRDGPRTPKQCSLAACTRPMRAGNLCERHYRQALKRSRLTEEGSKYETEKR